MDLYKAAFWPGEDLLVDGTEVEFTRLVGTRLNSEDEGFLLRLAFDVYRLFEQLVTSVAEQSGPIRIQLDESRIFKDPAVAELISYNVFLSQFNESAGLQQ